MKRWLLFLSLISLAVVPCVIADDFVDDVYYSAEKEIKQSSTTTPYYNKGAREFVFLDDTTVAHPDTVRAVIKYKK